MMESAETRAAHHRRPRRRPVLDRSPIRRIHFQRVVNAVIVMVVDVIADRSPEMLLVQRDDVVEDFAATTANPAFRQTILPWRLDACSLG